MRTSRLAIVCVALLSATLVSGAALAKDAKRPAPPKNLRGFLLKPTEPLSQVFPRTPAFAWAPVRGARCYEFELATSRSFTENAIVWSNVAYGVGGAKACKPVPADVPATAGGSVGQPTTGSSASPGGAPATGSTGEAPALIAPLKVPAVSIDVALPWFTGQPYALYSRVRAVTDRGPTAWSKPFAFNMRWPGVPAPMKTQNGLVRWSPVAGATGYQVWYPEIGKSFSTHTNVADLREFFTFHRADNGWWSTAKWRVRAVRRVFGTIPNGLPAVSYGPWSPVYTAKGTPPTSGKLQVRYALSDRSSSARKRSAHELMPGLTFSGDTGLDGQQHTLFRVYAATDRDCVNIVFRGSVVGSPAFAPRTTGPLALPTDPTSFETAPPKSKVPPDGTSEGTTFGNDWRAVVSSETRSAETSTGGTPATGSEAGPVDESLTLVGSKVDLPDIDFPTTRYYWTVVPVTVATNADGTKSGYWDVETPQDACAAGRVESFGKESDPVVTGGQSGAPFVSGLSPSGRMLASTQRRPLVFSTPLVAWQPATGATAYEVQWSKSRYPWRPVGSKVTLATSTLLDLDSGAWYYRVRGLNQAQLRKAEMAWSRPVAVRIARPTFAIAR
ncbi:MAG: hypothetical protein ACRC50_04040 [Gaiella sp.]